MGRIIAGSIALLVLVLLITPLRLRFEYSDELNVRINWLFVRLMSFPAGTEKMKRHDRKVKKFVKTLFRTENKSTDIPAAEEQTGAKTEKTAAAEEIPQQPQKKSAEPQKSHEPEKSSQNRLTLKELLAVVKFFWDSLSKPLKKICKATRVCGFRLDIVVGGDDAAKAAIRFGEMNIATGSAIAFLEKSFTMKKPDYNISCDFLNDETRTTCSFTASVTVIAAIVFFIWFIGRAVRNYLARNDAAAALEKLRK